MLKIKDLLIAETTDTKFIQQVSKYLLKYCSELKENFSITNTSIHYSGPIRNFEPLNIPALNILWVDSVVRKSFEKVYKQREPIALHHTYNVYHSYNKDIKDKFIGIYRLIEPYNTIPAKKFIVLDISESR